MMPSTLKSIYGVVSPLTTNLIEEKQRVRPTSGLEFVSSSHFPDNAQGDMLLGNTIGFLGIKQHQMQEDGTGYKTKHRQDTISGSDKNFRPVDLEFAPDGSLYVAEWHNVLIGHMQHNARNPLRDLAHGRTYSITYPSRPLVTPAKIADATIDVLLDNLKLPEYRKQYRTKRELRGRDSEEIASKLKIWVASLNPENKNFEHQRLEALWVFWGLNKIDVELLKQTLQSQDHSVRAASVHVLRYMGLQVSNTLELLKKTAEDTHSRARLEALTAVSWMEAEKGIQVLDITEKHAQDVWIANSFHFANTRLTNSFLPKEEQELLVTHLKGEDLETFGKGKKTYQREGYCVTCQQESGAGLQASGYPTLAGQDWVMGNEERLIKLTLNGLYGPMSVMGNQ